MCGIINFMILAIYYWIRSSYIVVENEYFLTLATNSTTPAPSKSYAYNMKGWFLKIRQTPFKSTFLLN